LLMARRTMGGSALEALVRLFLAGLELVEAEACSSLGANGVAALEDSGLIARSDRGFRASVRLAPFPDLVVAGDRAERHGSGAPDFVLPPGVVTSILSDFTVRRPVESALDLGCGSGVLGLLAASHARRVTALDVSPRAIAFSRFNAEMNG